MNEKDILNLLGNLDDSLIDETEKELNIKRIKRNNIRKYLSLAACLVLVLGITFNQSLKNKSDILEQLPNELSSANNGFIDENIEGVTPFYSHVAGKNSGSTVTSDFEYTSASNGEVHISDLLSNSLDSSNNYTVYRVLLNVFKDGILQDQNSDIMKDELERLYNEGYISAIETSYYENEVIATYVTLHATYDQIINFKNNPNLGYYLALYSAEPINQGNINSPANIN